MRIAAGLVAAFLVLVSPAAVPAAEAPPDAPSITTTKAEALDKLFADLKAEKDVAGARDIENAIWELWMESGDPQVDKLMGYSVAAMNARSFDLAIDFLSVIVRLKPDYAEGWNKRATAYWLTNDYDRSIADIEKTLALEPRHFGALSGLGMIMRSMGEKQKALAAFRRALAVDPHLANLQEAIDELEKDVGKDI